MSMIIVTERQFIIAEAILHMNVTEDNEEEGYGKTRKLRKVYIMHVTYVPQTSPNSSLSSRSRDNAMECQTRFYNLKEAKAAFREVVRQYREQNPDALYLDKIIEGMLNEE